MNAARCGIRCAVPEIFVLFPFSFLISRDLIYSYSLLYEDVGHISCISMMVQFSLAIFTCG